MNPQPKTSRSSPSFLTAREPEEEARTMEGRRLLIVEDEAPLRQAMARFFRSRGLKVVEAGDGSEALSSMASEMPDLILLDLAMPGVEGLDVLSRMKDCGWKVPVLVVSGAAGLERATEALRLGAKEYFSKPFNLAELDAAVEGCLGRA